MYSQYPLFNIVRECYDLIAPGARIYLVGGSVRDCLLGETLRDFDFMLEKKVFPFGKILAEKLHAELKHNRKLLTVSLSTSWGTVDLTQARAERYAYPGALPQVRPASWQEDLRRRDFTINALAFSLLPQGRGDLIDLTGGLEDLQRKLIRVLHQESFRDDPTRIIRGLRLKQRLGFSLESNTGNLMQRDMRYISCISPVRRLKEWILLCKEKDPPAVIEAIQELGGWDVLFPGITYEQEAVSKCYLPAGMSTGFRPWFLFLLNILKGFPQSLVKIAEYWGLTKKDYHSMHLTLSFLRDNKRVYPHKRKTKKIFNILPPESRYLLFQELFSQDQTWEQFCDELPVDLMPVNGNDIMQLGVAPGPQLGKMLKKLQLWYEEGRFDTREEGIRLALCLIKEDKECLTSKEL